jgi:hypothetical protein
MKRPSNTSSLPCTPERFWQVFFDEDYLRAFYLEALGFRAFRLLERTDTTRKIHVVPKINLPGPVAKLVGESFAYEEHGTLDRAAGLWTWRLQPAGGRELVRTSGTVRVLPDGAAAIKRIDEVTIESSVFAIGGLIESTAEKETRASWAKEAPFFTRWLTSH